MGVLQSAARGDRELSRGSVGETSTSSTIRRIRPPGTRKVPFSRELFIERDDFREDPPKKFFRLAPGTRGAPARRVLHHLHQRGQGRRPARSSSCAAPTIRRRAAATRPTAARSRRRCTGCRRRTRSTPRCGSTIGCSRVENPDAVGDYLADLNPHVARGA